MSTEQGQAALPYNGSSGWSGSSTSKERADISDSTGVTAQRQQRVLTYVEGQGAYGATVFEMCQHFGLPTNSIAPACTQLHHAGVITRLTVRRGKHQVYVWAAYVNGRETTRPGRGRVAQ